MEPIEEHNQSPDREGGVGTRRKGIVEWRHETDPERLRITLGSGATFATNTHRFLTGAALIVCASARRVGNPTGHQKTEQRCGRP
ncbi:MAG: hypothetical protein MI923_21395 [Phycisphaerales bacterium]|nr:hypothetical protein [Phycisphaerales bacterium]